MRRCEKKLLAEAKNHPEWWTTRPLPSPDFDWGYFAHLKDLDSDLVKLIPTLIRTFGVRLVRKRGSTEVAFTQRFQTFWSRACDIADDQELAPTTVVQMLLTDKA